MPKEASARAEQPKRKPGRAEQICRKHERRHIDGRSPILRRNAIPSVLRRAAVRAACRNARSVRQRGRVEHGLPRYSRFSVLLRRGGQSCLRKERGQMHGAFRRDRHEQAQHEQQPERILDARGDAPLQRKAQQQDQAEQYRRIQRGLDKPRQDCVHFAPSSFSIRVSSSPSSSMRSAAERSPSRTMLATSSLTESDSSFLSRLRLSSSTQASRVTAGA
ncbi:unknown [Clostridium sp. CAG:1024]|nr:unknown [Clostridium sp. CAG:1024]